MTLVRWRRSLVVLPCVSGICLIGLLTVSWVLPATTVLVEIPVGARAQQVGEILAEHGLILSPGVFKGLAMATGQARRLKAGTYQFSPRLTSWNMLWAIARGHTVRVKVTVPEGWTARQIADRLQALGVTEAAPFLAMVQAQRLEGQLFPETYFFPSKSPPEAVIKVFLREFERRVQPLLTDALDPHRKSVMHVLQLRPQQLLTLASLIEREARVPEERPLIAGVFYNRLKRGWLLESCATVQYALGASRPQLTYEDLDVDSPYNTYRHAGLPPGPICNPGAASIQAALNPAKTDALFFVADGQGTHRFSRYYQEHLEEQRRR